MNTKKLIISLIVILIIISIAWLFLGKKFIGSDSESMNWASASRLDSVSSQFFTVNLKEEELLIGDKGSVLYLQPGTFMDENRNIVNDNVVIELKEVNTISEFMQSGISTLSNGKLLSTEGSYYINAKANGKNLSVNPDVGLYAMFPTLEKSPDVKLFTGTLTETGDINWEPTEQREEEIPKPKEPDLPEPESLKDFKMMYDLKWVNNLLTDIDNGVYEKRGDLWVPEGESGMQWSDDFVSKCRIWYKHNKDKEKLIAKRQEKIQERNDKLYEAWERYYRRPEVQAYLKYKDSQVKKMGTSSYEYKLNTMGWVNCDKFNNQQLVVFKGRIMDEKKKPVKWVRVHLISEKEMIHLSFVSDDGKFSFNYPLGLPFEIYAHGNGMDAKTGFDGKSEKLEDVVMRR